MIDFNHVDKIFQKDWYALRDITFHLDKGEFLFIVGPSGAGKSTLLKLIYMDIFPTRGEVKVAGYSSSSIKTNEIPILRRKIGVIFQDFKLLPYKNIYENVAFALEVTNTPRRKIKKKVINTLAEIGISHKRHSYPHQLSGGEQQKVAIARALVREPFILIADEPTGNIDPEGTDEIIKLLLDINASGTAVLMATHERKLVDNAPKRKIVMEEGKIVEDTDAVHN